MIDSFINTAQKNVRNDNQFYASDDGDTTQLNNQPADLSTNNDMNRSQLFLRSQNQFNKKRKNQKRKTLISQTSKLSNNLQQSPNTHLSSFQLPISHQASNQFSPQVAVKINTQQQLLGNTINTPDQDQSETTREQIQNQNSYIPDNRDEYFELEDKTSRIYDENEEDNSVCGIIERAIKSDDLSQVLQFQLSSEQILELRFERNLNILQAACFYDAENVIDWLSQKFEKDQIGRQNLINYSDPQAGNKAIHFAVVNGNRKVLEILLSSFGADPFSQTGKGLSVIHCAAQNDKGLFSIFYFHENFKVPIDLRDNFDCTPLHFAVLNRQFKIVETLIALGADPNSQIKEGLTSLHLAVTKSIDEPDEFDEYKRIIKELLFNGANRQLADIEGITPLMIAEERQEEIPDDNFKSLNILLELLSLANEKDIDLENFCFYCKIIKSSQTFHCNFCKSCTEKFDHHCVYINNCLVEFAMSNRQDYKIQSYDNSEVVNILDWTARIYTILVNLIQSIPLILQLKEQTQKLMKVKVKQYPILPEKVQPPQTPTQLAQRTSRTNQLNQTESIATQNQNLQAILNRNSNNQNNQSLPLMTEYEMKQSLLQNNEDAIINVKQGFCYNFKQLFKHSPPSQKELKDFLFSSESDRFSTFIMKKGSKYRKRENSPNKPQTNYNYSQLSPDRQFQSNNRDNSENRLVISQTISGFKEREREKVFANNINTNSNVENNSFRKTALPPNNQTSELLFEDIEYNQNKYN
eukprot:403365161